MRSGGRSSVRMPSTRPRPSRSPVSAWHISAPCSTLVCGTAEPIALRRTQMRWVLAAETTTVAATASLLLLGDGADWLWPVWIASLGLPVAAIAIAITRYHLYDIDRILTRSISYLIVTAVLVMVFATVVLLLQAAISVAVAAPGSALDPRVVAVSTLTVAALFEPLRSRVQTAVDRRFHRQRYDSGRLVDGLRGPDARPARPAHRESRAATDHRRGARARDDRGMAAARSGLRAALDGDQHAAATGCGTLGRSTSARRIHATVRRRRASGRVPGTRQDPGRGAGRVPGWTRRDPGPAARHRRRRGLLPRLERQLRGRVHDE